MSIVKRKLVIGSRGSKLAVWQANHIAGAISSRYPNIEVGVVTIVTTGDRILDVPLAKIGGKGLFTKELETAMLAGEIDLAVHSLKDMPTELSAGLTLAAITRRTDPGDALISLRYETIDDLPHGARVGTSSLRRRAQLLQYRSDLQISDLRGNLDTRLNKLKSQDLDAIVLAVAGLKRLGWEGKISQILPFSICLPAVGQGALAIEARRDDAATLGLLSFLDDEMTHVAAVAERSFLRTVQGGCQVPVAVYGQVVGAELILQALIASVDGQMVIRDAFRGCVADAESLGKELAQRMLAAGGRELLLELGDLVVTGGNSGAQR
jgi:hydroxymethylbilane synthase